MDQSNKINFLFRKTLYIMTKPFLRVQNALDLIYDHTVSFHVQELTSHESDPLSRPEGKLKHGN